MCSRVAGVFVVDASDVPRGEAVRGDHTRQAGVPRGAEPAAARSEKQTSKPQPEAALHGPLACGVSCGRTRC